MTKSIPQLREAIKDFEEKAELATNAGMIRAYRYFKGRAELAKDLLQKKLEAD